MSARASTSLARIALATAGLVAATLSGWLPPAAAGVPIHADAPAVDVISLTVSPRTVVTTAPQRHTPATYVLQVEHPRDVLVRSVGRLRFVTVACVRQHSVRWCSEESRRDWAETSVLQDVGSVTVTRPTSTRTRFAATDREQIDLSSGLAIEQPGEWMLASASLEVLAACPQNPVSHGCVWQVDTDRPATPQKMELQYATGTRVAASATRVRRDATVTVTGAVRKLTPSFYGDGPVGGNPHWSAYSNARVSVLFDPVGAGGPRTVVASVTIRTDGTFTARIRVPSSGVLTVRTAANTERHLVASSASLRLTVN